METNNFKNILGLNQNEMAMLLKITRSQWAMYQTGKRPLPREAKLQLAELLNFMLSQENLKQNIDLKEKEHLKLKILEKIEIDRLLKEKAVATKLKRVQEKYKREWQKDLIFQFLENNKNSNLKELFVLKNNTNTFDFKKSLISQMEMELQIELLKQEQLSLKKNIQIARRTLTRKV